jgi:hypothetical protein
VHKPAFDSGFTEEYRGDLQRIINRDRQFNVRRALPVGGIFSMMRASQQREPADSNRGLQI